MALKLKLKSISYAGKSIGRDIRAEIEILGKSLRIDKRIKHGSTAVFDDVIGVFEAGALASGGAIKFKVTEKDWLFSDTGQTSEVFKVESSKPLPQTFEFTVSVTERRRVFWKSTAVFKIVIEAVTDEAGQIDKIKKYQSYSGEDYNRYDGIILKVVDYWNSEFDKDTDPPQEPLDPNLVKAIAYQESRVGNDPRNNGLVNIMQVGNPGDPSLQTLRGELPEYWIHNGRQILLKYDTIVGTVKDSVHWGVRWLYHKAQYIGADERRYWYGWKTAVHEYGPNKKQYTDSVWDIYTKGVKQEGKKVIKLWPLLIFLVLIIPVFVFFDDIKVGYIKRAVLRTYHTEARPADNVVVRFFKPRSDLFFAILEGTKDWSEDIYVGRMKHSAIEWLGFKNPPTEQSILSARFLELGGIPYPLLEVFGETHMGNGKVYLYSVKDHTLDLLFDAVAVDYYNNNVWRPGGYPQYGYSICGEIYKDGKLFADYRDLNDDGASDVILSGATEVICQRMEGQDPGKFMEVKAAEIPVRLTHFISPPAK